MNDDILFLIRDKLPVLSKSERKLAEYILAKPEKVIRFTASQLAHEAASSPATIIRFTRSIGLNGFTELKLQLSSDMGQRQAEVYTDIDKGDNPSTIKTKLKARIDYVLNKNVACLSEENVEKCVELVEDARTIYMYGVGASSLVAQDMYQKFSRLGKVVVFDQDYHHMAGMMSSVGQGSLFVGVSNSGETRETIRLAQLATERGMKVIGLTSFEDSKLAKIATYSLISDHEGENPLRAAATVSLMAQLFVVDVFFLSYAAKHYDQTIELLKNTKEAVKKVKIDH
ncbi:RpiR family transcriptional regulator [Enterococcus florum]|uniref:RpiR family transcriptional regulator n=1 Tax=Enterococcus florum TaxID=2480627 RepID=A0A4P5PEZ7_9ENTE|nr:MurR/RpiR family transcriptional regulator [Enterococcus florum]GCF94931.1 RpiR family transcriptional regulator [Enterococcus florum]